MNQLEEAAALIENGWCTNELRNGDGKYCSVGAVLAAAGHNILTGTALIENADGTYSDAYVLADTLPGIKALADEIISIDEDNEQGSLSDTVYYWNDKQTDVNEVLEVFKYAAKRL